MASAHRSQRGRDAELEVMALMAEQGFCVASRRHIGGPGDILGVQPKPGWPWLVEVKTTAASPYERFGPDRRRALVEEANRIDAHAYLAWRPPTSRHWHWISANQFPETPQLP